MMEWIVEIRPSQEKSKDYDNLRDDDIKHDKVQNSWKLNVRQGPIKDKEPNELEVRTSESQLRRSTRVRKSNLMYANILV